jgi:hypothetical protein
MKYLFLLMLCYSQFATARVNQNDQTWAIMNSFINLKNKWQLYLEYQPRFVKDRKYNATTLYRTAIGRDIGYNFTVWLGYGFVENNYPAYLHEDRPFLQLIHSNMLNDNFKLVNRTRYETRFFRHVTDAVYKLRHLVRGQYRFTNSSWGMVLYNEWFWNASSVNDQVVIKEGFDQNRAFIGISYYFGKNAQHLAELGYMNQYINGPSVDSNNDNAAFQMTFKF